jgi:hypothetical protein
MRSRTVLETNTRLGDGDENQLGKVVEQLAQIENQYKKESLLEANDKTGISSGE